MATMRHTLHLGSQDIKTGPNTSGPMALAALVLALFLGFGAAYVQHERAAQADPTIGLSKDGSPLDGRGKWGGSM
ncbi:MAG: hypothetical protein ACR2Q4_07505 [Geminicoccaceae bacterium]